MSSVSEKQYENWKLFENSEVAYDGRKTFDQKSLLKSTNFGPGSRLMKDL